MSKCKLCDFKSVSTAVLVRHKRNEHTTDSTNQSDGVEGAGADLSKPVVAQVGGNQSRYPEPRRHDESLLPINKR